MVRVVGDGMVNGPSGVYFQYGGMLSRMTRSSCEKMVEREKSRELRVWLLRIRDVRVLWCVTRAVTIVLLLHGPVVL